MVKLIKRADISKKKASIIRLFAIFLSLLVTAIFLLLIKHNPINVYISMIEGSFGSAYRIKATIVKAIPLIITSLGISVAFKMKFWNIGAEGQIIMGAFAASFFALNYDYLPQIILIPLMMIASMVMGGLWGLFPAFFKAKFDTNETIFTLMMNYIALKWITYLQYGPWKDPASLGFPKIANFADNAIPPKIFGVHMGWIIALLLTVLIYIFLNHTKKGYEISVIGESQDTARYAGMKVGNVIVFAMIISGAICGLAGMFEVTAVNGTLNVDVSGGYGYTAIITTWLAQLSSFAIVWVSLLFAVLIQGGVYIQTAFNIPQSAADILQGLILFFVIGSELFIRYKVIFERKKTKGGNN